MTERDQIATNVVAVFLQRWSGSLCTPSVWEYDNPFNSCIYDFCIAQAYAFADRMLELKPSESTK